MRQDNINMLQETLQILEQGYYVANRKKVPLKLSREQMKAAVVYLPDRVERICSSRDFPHVHRMGRIGTSCENMDSFALARKRYQDCAHIFSGKGENRILVLNLANPVNPGGGVRRGARAQEEDLCRKSSLLLSLEGEEARPYYEFNRTLRTYMGSDAVIITPDVEIIRDERGNLLEDSVIVSVLTCAAPMVTMGKEGMSEAEYEAMVYRRITGMLKVAAYRGYQALVLGAFGCGAFGNDAHIVSDLFYRALKEFEYDGMKAKDFFCRIDFAVLDRSERKYNYREFSRNFNCFYRDEDEEERQRVLKEIRKTETCLDAVRGCLIGGAAGDALGYAVEFWPESRIFPHFGEGGIRSYVTDPETGKALISDDTQMTLFTADGILVGETRGSLRGIAGRPASYVALAYHDWPKTQNPSEWEKTERAADGSRISWLLDVPELYSRRAPGNTCLSALADANRRNTDDYIANPVNDSKGCGGVMRVAPLALRYRPGNDRAKLRDLDLEGAQIAAITRGHSLGYMPAAVVTHILCRILGPEEKKDLKEIILNARDMAEEIFAGDSHLRELVRIIDLAVELSENEEEDLDNIHRIGEGWVAEETLGIALYCALRYRNDFSSGIIAAVNHNGDSDSTGAVTGNILGALLGFEAIESRWKENLELYDVILEMADDLCHGCQMQEYGYYREPAWIRKYVEMRKGTDL